MGTRGRSRLALLGCASLLSAPLVAPTATHAAPQGHRLEVVPQIVQAGSALTAVLQPGTASRIAFYLSKDRHLSAGDVLVADKRPKAAGQGRSKSKLRVPRRARPMAAYLLACPSEKAGPCTASAERIAVIRRPSPAKAKPVPGGPAATAVIGAGGGSLSAGAPAEPVTLTVPAGALVKETALALTPLAKLGGGLPGHLTAAAGLGPDGLPLARVARLRLPGAGSAGVAFSSGGGNLHLTPLSKGQIAISTLGGGAGAIEAPKAKLAAFARRHVAADPISQLEQLAAVANAPQGGRRHPEAAASAAGHSSQTEELNAYLTAGAYQVEAIGQSSFLLGVADYQQWDTISRSLPGNEISALPALETQVKATLAVSGLREVVDDEGRCEAGDLSRRTHMLELEAAAGSIGIGAIAEAVRGAVARCFQFDLLIDSEIEHHDEESGFEGSFTWHYQAKVPLDYESLVPSVTHFSAHGSNEGKYATAEGSEIESNAGECNDNGSTVEGVYEMLEGHGGDFQATGDFTVPLVPDEPSRVKVTVASSATESYNVEVRDESDPKCEGATEIDLPQWWYETWISLVGSGGTSKSPGEPVEVSLEPPDPQKAPPPNLVGELTVPAEANGDHGTTKIEVIHDPRHVLLPGFPPA